MQEKFAVQPFDRNRDNVFAGDEVEGRVGMVEKWLGLQGFKTYDLEPTRACNAELGSQKVNRCGLGRHIKFLGESAPSKTASVGERYLEWLESLLATLEHPTDCWFFLAF